MAREGATIVAADVNINNLQSTVAGLTGRSHNLLLWIQTCVTLIVIQQCCSYFVKIL